MVMKVKKEEEKIEWWRGLSVPKSLRKGVASEEYVDYDTVEIRVYESITD